MRGGKREGSGRKVGWRKEISEQRPTHTIRAFDEEWLLIKEFIQLVRKGKTAQAAQIINELKDA